MSDSSLAALADEFTDGRIGSKQYQAGFDEAVHRNSLALRRAIREDRFRAAIAWQSSDAHEAIEALLLAGDDAPRNKRRRRRERIAERYLQRYSSKNDTIGFFGPFSWFLVDPSVSHVEQQPGPALIRDVSVRFEDWALDAFSQWLARQPCLRPWLIPAPHPHHSISDLQLRRPGRRPLAISERRQAVLQACDRIRNAKEVADILIHERPDLFTHEGPVFEELTTLLAERLITWDADLPIDEVSEDRLVALLNRIENPDAAHLAREAWDKLASHRDALLNRWDEPDHVASTIQSLNASFEALTGEDSYRRAGQMYAGRSLVYLDSRRDLELKLGSAFLSRIEKPLDVMLTSAKWITGAILTVFNAHLHDLVAQTNATTLDQIWFAAAGFFTENDEGILTHVLRDFRERWWAAASVAGVRRPESESFCPSVQIDPDAMLAALNDEFGEPMPSWETSTVHAPDFQIGARSLEAFESGDYSIVLGELHVALPTLLGPPFDWGRSPRTTTIDQVSSEQSATGRLIPALPRTWPNNTARSLVPASRRDVVIAFAATPGLRSDQTVAAIDVHIERSEDGHLSGVLPDGTGRPLADFFGHFLSGFASGVFKTIAGTGSMPRVSIGDVVVFRQTWNIPIEPGSFPLRDEAFLYADVRRWQRDHELPDRVFVKLAAEVKPFRVDFTSAASVSSFHAFVRSALLRTPDSGVTALVSEALPDLREAPFYDANGEAYLGEIRMHVSDRTASANR